MTTPRPQRALTLFFIMLRHWPRITVRDFITVMRALRRGDTS